jgi:hypothetical protein
MPLRYAKAVQADRTVRPLKNPYGFLELSLGAAMPHGGSLMREEVRPKVHCLGI